MCEGEPPEPAGRLGTGERGGRDGQLHGGTINQERNPGWKPVREGEDEFRLGHAKFEYTWGGEVGHKSRSGVTPV